MKNSAKRTLAALLALILLVLAIPINGAVSLAAGEAGEEAETTSLIYADFEGGKDNFSDFGQIQHVGTSMKNEKANGYLNSYAYTLADHTFGETTKAGNFLGTNVFEVNSVPVAHRKSFTFDITFLQNENPIDHNIRLRFSLGDGSTVSADYKDASGRVAYLRSGEGTDMSPYVYTKMSANIVLTAKSSDLDIPFARIADTGVVTFAPYNSGKATLGDVTTGDVNASYVFNYSAEKNAYLVDVYANGKLLLEDYALSINGTKIYSAAALENQTYYYEDGNGGYVEASGTLTASHTESLSAESYVNGTTSAYLYQAQFYNSSSFGQEAFYPVYKNGSDEIDYYACKYTAKYDNVFLTMGTDLPALAVNREAITNQLRLYTAGKPLAGAEVDGTYSTVVIPGTEIKDGVITLPEIEGGWFDPTTHAPITKVSSALLGTGELAAYTTPKDATLIDENYNSKTENASAGTGALYKKENGNVYVQMLRGASGINVPVYTNGGDAMHSLRDYYGNSATMTISFSLTPETDVIPDLYLRFRTDKGGVDTMRLFETKLSKIFFAHEKVAGPKIKAGETYDVSMIIHVVNTSDSAATVTVTGYVNGVCYGTGSQTNVAINVGSCGNATIAVERIHFYSGGLNDGSSNSVRIDDARVYLGVDREKVSDIENLAGASIRLGKTANESGLRFSFRMAREKYEALIASGAKIGAIIVPTDWLESGYLPEITHEALLAKGLSDAVIDTIIDGYSSESTEQYCYFNISIVQMLAQNYGRSFTAVAYVLDENGEYSYSHVSDSRSVNEVARNYAASGNLNTPAGANEETAADYARKQAIVKGYLDRVLVLETSGDTLVPVNVTEGYLYETPYTVTHSDGVLKMVGAGMENVTTVIIDGIAYTGGWEKVANEENAYSAPYAIE